MSTKIKKSVFIVAICMILTLAFGTSVFAARDAVGDLNRDGVKDELDAIHLLNHYIFDGLLDDFEIDQPSDYNGDGYVDENDAIYLLNNVIFGDLSGLFHICDYPDTWSFVETVKPTCKDAGYTKVKCECGKEAEIMPTEKTDEHNFDWENPDLTHKATCLENGYITATCTVCGEKSVKQQAATGEHDWKGGDCENGATCTLCNSTKPATGHNYSKTPTFVKKATCEGGYKEYACKNEGCTSVHTEALAPTDHRFGDNAWVSTGLRATDKKCTFVYVENAQCLDCHQTFERTTGEVIKHTETTTVTPATCVKPGEKKITCSECGEAILTAEMPVNELAHKFDDGVVNQNVTTYTCQNEGCSHTKTTVKASEDGKVDLKDAEEVELEGGAAIIPDENIKNELGDKEITISIEKVQANDLENLSDSDKELLKQLGDAPVFDLSLTANGEKVTNFGENNVMTVRLPYTLEEGDDPDCIIIWYIGDDGHIDHFNAKYVDGYAVFETNHFSYYTVTRMTPAQRCEYYGQHNYQTTAVPATCVSGGYTISICTRCSHQEISDEIPAKGHAFVGTKTPATCDKAGSTVYNCENCTVSYTETIKALGHKCELSKDEYTAPSCTAKGEAIYRCTNTDCEYSYTEVLPQLDHEYEKNVIAPDCENGGYTENECKNCDHSFISGTVSALGHKYVDSVCFVCKKECEHNFEYGVCKDCLVVKEGSAAPDETECEHNIVYSYEFVDKKMPMCYYGVIITESCSDCSYTKTYITNECVTWEVKVDISEYDSCGHHDFSYVTCPCGAATDFIGDISLDEVTETQNKNQLILGCKDCEMHLIYTDSKAMSGCFSIYNRVLEFYCGDEHIHTQELSIKEPYHDFVDYKYELFDGHSCTNGVRCTAYCRNCDTTISFVSFGHIYKDYTKYDFAAIGSCEHHIMRINSCICGEENIVDIYDFDYDITEEGEVYFCKECNTFIYHSYTDSKPNDKCEVTRVHTYQLMVNDKLVDTITLSDVFIDHNYKTTIEKLGNSCEDGYILTHVCENCGHTYQEQEKGHLMEEVIVDLSGHNVCEHHVVYKHVCTQCDYIDGIYCGDLCGESTKNGYNYFCKECSLVITEIEESGDKDENCHVSFTYTITLYVGEEKLLEGKTTGGSFDHNFEITYEMLGTTCEDGVLATYTCLDCQFVEISSFYGHSYESFSFYFSDFGGCAYHYDAYGEKCQFCDNIDYIEFYHNFDAVPTENGQLYLCKECGIEILVTTTIGERDEYCNALVTENYIFTDKEGNEFANFFTTYENTFHQFNDTYQFIGKTCDDGVVVTSTCEYCKEQYVDQYYGHILESISIDLSEHGGCTNHRIRASQCQICGDYKNVRLLGGALYSSPIEGGRVTSCENCPIELIRLDTTGEKDEFCIEEIILNYILSIEGNEILNCTETSWEENHNYKTTYEFFDKELGCDGGVIIYNTCVDCGASEEWQERGHTMILQEVYNFSDHGHTCKKGGFTVSSCPCGYMKEISYDLPNFTEEWLDSYKDENGVWHDLLKYTCLDCEEFYFTEDYCFFTDENCKAQGVTTITIGEFTVTITRSEGVYHDHAQKEILDESYEENNPDGSSINVVALEYYCPKCLTSFDKSIITDSYDENGVLISENTANYSSTVVDGETVWTLSHTYLVEYVYAPNILSPLPSVEHNVEYHNGEEYYWNKTEYAYEPDNFCRGTITYADSDGKNYVTEFVSHADTYHKYVITEGGKTCEDGLDEIYYCSACDEEIDRYINVSHEHIISIDSFTPTTSIDLTEYGAACHGTIDVYSCTCGERFEWRVNSECDFDFSVHYDIKDGVQHEYCIYSCAVSDCGFKLVADQTSISDENCNETLCITYYLGVSDDNTNYAETFSFETITGSTYHTQFIERTSATKDYFYRESVCENCGAVGTSEKIEGNIRTYITYEYFNDGSYHKETSEYMAIGDNYDYYQLSNLSEEFDAKGECTYYYRTDYTYPKADEGNYCYVIVSTSGSHSSIGTHEEEYHTWTYNNHHCTPEIITVNCLKCGELLTRHLYGSDHFFEYNEEKGCYVCSLCSLESDTDANGLVIFEDKTSELGNGNSYIVGWRNDYGENFVWSIVLIDTSSGEMYPLDTVVPHMLDEYTIALDAFEIRDIAKSLGIGDCEYMVRLALVPTDMNGELEYAITLDPHAYQLTEHKIYDTGCEADWTYKCAFCEHSYTLTKKGHQYNHHSSWTFSIVDDVVTVTEIKNIICEICTNERIATVVKKYGANGLILSEAHYSNGNTLSYTYTYDYDYENGTYTQTCIDGTNTSSTVYNLFTGEIIE